MTKKSFSGENGNALWFILIAVVLLGALTMLLTRSGSTVNQSGDVEQMRVKASQMMRWAKGLEATIDQMKLRGISESEISFENNETTADYTNNSCANDDCKIFGSGGGQTYLTPPAGANDGSEWVFNSMNNIGTTDYPIGTTAAATGNDLVLFLPNVTTPLCIQINKDLNVGVAGTVPVETDAPNLDPFTGAYTAPLIVLNGDNVANELNGHSSGCFFDDVSNTNIFYYVLLAR